VTVLGGALLTVAGDAMGTTSSDRSLFTPAGGDGGAGPRVAVLGTGLMGCGMARTLLRAGLRTDVWDRRPERTARLTAERAIAHASPAEAVGSADVVITMLPDGPAVMDVVVEQGMLQALRPQSVLAQMSTIGVPETAQLAAIAARERSDIYFVDAPVSGTRQPAETGQLLILASGPDGARLLLAPVFDAIGIRTLWLGPAGSGSRLKLVLSTWLAFLMEGIAESVALADALDVDHLALRDAMLGSPLDVPAARAKFAKLDAGDESPELALRLATKDVDLALAEAGEQTLPVAAAITRRWHELVSAGLGDADVIAARHGLGQQAML
jgi:3-hydroxyisobutyrate dehydrogenase